MRALVVYESMYGNTHLVAEAIARGLRPRPGAGGLGGRRAVRECPPI